MTRSVDDGSIPAAEILPRPNARGIRPPDRNRQTRRNRMLFLGGTGALFLAIALPVAASRDKGSNLVGITPGMPPAEMPGYDCMTESRANGLIVEGSTSQALHEAELCLAAVLNNSKTPNPEEVAILAGVFWDPNQP